MFRFAASPTVVQTSVDRPQSASGGKRPAMRSNLPMTNGRRPGSARGSGRSSAGTCGLEARPQRHRAVAAGAVVAAAAVVSSSSDAYSDDTASSANDHTPTSAPPG